MISVLILAVIVVACIVHWYHRNKSISDAIDGMDEYHKRMYEIHGDNYTPDRTPPLFNHEKRGKR